MTNRELIIFASLLEFHRRPVSETYWSTEIPRVVDLARKLLMEIERQLEPMRDVALKAMVTAVAESQCLPPEVTSATSNGIPPKRKRGRPRKDATAQGSNKPLA